MYKTGEVAEPPPQATAEVRAARRSNATLERLTAEYQDFGTPRQVGLSLKYSGGRLMDNSSH